MPGEERHCISLPASSCTEIGSSLATFCLNGLDDALTEQAGGKELRITTDNFYFILVINLVSEIDIVSENFQESFGAINSLHHGFQFFERHCGNLVTIFDPSPGVEMFIRGSDCAKACLHTIADACERTVVKKTGNISPITDVYLLPGIMNSGIGICRVFEFYNTDRQSVNI